ncbi:MAG: hypothetical protein JWP87_2903 [Labilithrix sp.]|nr:hypothetical protein [Labilithrix sp.]
MLTVAGLGGCAADSASDAPADDGAEVDELNATSLRAATAVKGTVTAGSSITLAYDRADSLYPRAIPYLAVEILAAPEPAAAAASGGIHPMNGEIIDGQSITVQGNFPGRPKVLVVDENFRQLTSTTAKTLPDGTERAEFAAPRGAGKRFILVRDGRWSKPMQFEIGVGR